MQSLHSDFTVFVVDDDDATRDAIGMVLQQYGYTVKCFPDGASFLDGINGSPDGCVLLDLRMPVMDGLSTAAELQRRGHLIPLAFLSGAPDFRNTVDAMKLGASDFLMKPVPADRLLGIVEEMREQSGRLHDVIERTDRAKRLMASLTHREREVLDGMLHGLQNKQIARALGISHRTVEIHRARVMEKTRTSNVLDLARVLQAGQLPIDTPELENGQNHRLDVALLRLLSPH